MSDKIEVATARHRVTTIAELRAYVSQFKLDDSLLYLNRVLSVSRGDADEPRMQRDIASLDLEFKVPAFAVHLIAKQLLLSAHQFAYSAMGSREFAHALSIALNLDDPIAHDPNFRTANPAGFFERFFAQQIPSQDRMLLQRLGIASGLFALQQWRRRCRHGQVKLDLEATLGTTVEAFIGLGLITHSLRQARDQFNVDFQGTFGHMYLVEAYASGFELCVPENWQPFLKRVSATVADFRAISSEPRFSAADELYSPWEFNAITAKPIIDIGNDRFIAVDPDLVVERVTRGLFHDLFDAYGVKYTAKRFGPLFEDFVGKLLSGVVSNLWSTCEWENPSDGVSRKSESKVCDWIVTEENVQLFFECKSFRPTLELHCTGSVAGVENYARKVAEAVRQCWEHSRAIRRGEFEGITRTECEVYVIVTYGQFHLINSSFVRKIIDEEIVRFGIEGARYVVTSLAELDSIVSLAERHGSLANVFTKIVDSPSETAFGPFASDLAECAISSMTRERGRAALGFKGRSPVIEDDDLDVSL